MDIEKFNPTVAELHAMIAVTKEITVSDLKDKAQLEVVKKNRIALKNARVAITKKGKELREDAVSFQKAVIAKEKELVAIIEPEEDRLQAIEDEADALNEREKRLDVLPKRKERLTALKDAIEVSDDALLGMDGPEFEGYFNKRSAEKNEADRQALEAEQRAISEEKAKIVRDMELREAEERARKEERERLEREAKERAEREELEKKAAEEKAKREKLEAEQRERDEKERLEKEQRYRAFMAEHGYSDDTKADFKVEKVDNKVRLFKWVGTFVID